jgi:hypothetical protein
MEFFFGFQLAAVLVVLVAHAFSFLRLQLGRR